MRQWGLMAVLVLAFGLSIEALLALVHGMKANPPNEIDSWAMREVKHNVFVGNVRQRNPIKTTANALADGKEAFSHYCVACHGMDGQNTGVPFANRMSPPAPSLASPEVQSYTDGQLKWVIDNGIWPSGMPGSSGTLSDEEIWSIVIYLRHLPAAGSAGEPEMYTH